MDEVSGAHQIFQVTGFHLLAGHDLLDGREFENHAQNGGHGAMIPVSLIVEDQVLQLAPLDGHQRGAVSGGDGGKHTLGACVELDGCAWAGADADAAAEAEGFVETGLLALGLVRVSDFEAQQRTTIQRG